MPKEYVHLSLLERDQITILRHDKKSMGDIAKSLGRSKSSISREIKRNSSAEYNLYMSHRAHERSELRREQASARLRLKDALIVSYVTTKLKLNWSPEIIAGTIKLEQPGLSISLRPFISISTILTQRTVRSLSGISQGRTVSEGPRA